MTAVDPYAMNPCSNAGKQTLTTHLVGEETDKFFITHCSLSLTLDENPLDNDGQNSVPGIN